MSKYATDKDIIKLQKMKNLIDELKDICETLEDEDTRDFVESDFRNPNVHFVLTLHEIEEITED